MNLSLTNLGEIWLNCVAIGIGYAIVSATLADRQQLDGLIMAMPGYEVTVSACEAGPGDPCRAHPPACFRQPPR